MAARDYPALASPVSVTPHPRFKVLGKGSPTCSRLVWIRRDNSLQKFHSAQSSISFNNPIQHVLDDVPANGGQHSPAWDTQHPSAKARECPSQLPAIGEGTLLLIDTRIISL